MSNTLKLGNGKWATGKDTLLSFSDTNNNYKPLPFSFSRDSSGTVINKDGLIETVGSGEPRIDFKDNTKGSLLLEPSRSNDFPYSELSQGTATGGFSYKSSTTTVDANTINTASPKGDNTAAKITTSAYNSVLDFYKDYLIGANDITYSLFVKKGSIKDIDLEISGTGVSSGTKVSFDLENGIYGTLGGDVISAFVLDYGNDWYRIGITSSNSPTSSAIFRIKIPYIGNLYVWGIQLEQGSYATSYIPTSGSAVTRVGDACNNGANEQVINSTEGVLYYEVSAQDNSITTSILSISNGSNANSLYSGFSSTSNTIQAQLVVGGVAQTNMNYVVSDRTEFNKVAILYQNNNHKMYVNGVQASIDTSGLVPSPKHV